MDKFNKIVQQLKDFDGYLVPHNDAHQSEYIAECDERLAYISNFDGSNGLGLIMKDKAFLWTDSRYYIQAKNQLQEPWQMLKMEEVPWFNFVVENYPNSKIGYDPNLFTAQNVETRTQFFKEKNIQFLPIEQNLIDIIWSDKPKIPLNQIFLHEKQFCGLHTIEKLQKLKVRVQEKNCNFLLTSKLDEIAWTLNLRGSDIEFNPVFFSFLIIDFTQDIQGTLFINDQKVPNEIKEYLQKECNIQIKKYDEINIYLKNFNNGKMCLSKNSINQHIFQQIQDSKFFENCDNQIDLLKEIKGQREMEGMKECHIYDGVALVQFLAWLENEILVNNQSINEYQAAQKAKYFREQQKYNVGLSFETISSTGPNAAIIHYKPSKDNSSIINPDQIYLVDSGGQYKCGTTDVTRTIHMKQPTQDEIKAYTLVLQGNLDIEQQIWNINNPMNGADLDILARKRLIENGMNYGHGTGHGVGYYLNVHEGPQGISKFRTQPFQHGLIVSDEPGYYKEGFFGIRIENLIMCVQKDEQLSFINLTLCPYDRKLIDKTMCTQKEIDFINNYHQRCWNELSQFLEKDLISLNWLKTQTQAL